MSKKIGIVTTGGDGPGLNAALRGVGKAAHGLGVEVVGFQDGMLGVAQRRMVELEGGALSNILTLGGTILGTSRDLPNRAMIDGKPQDVTAEIGASCAALGLDGLVLLGGSDAQESARWLQQAGLNVLTLPVTIDNDLPGTDTTIGFDTALGVAAEAIDRLHSTASSHHRIIIVEVMGRTTGWLALGAGIAGGADVILIPEIPYNEQVIVDAIQARQQAGKRFSIVAVSEGAVSSETVRFFERARRVNQQRRSGEELDLVAGRLEAIERQTAGSTIHLSNQLEKRTGMEARLTILGYLQRGGSPSAADRVLATHLGTACARLACQGTWGLMVGVQAGGAVTPVPLAEVAGKSKAVPPGHPWLEGARRVGTSLGE
jgi:6-phosphofructokinase 1